jgi:tRNA threonylcarbamoyladenosine biosynthesis protein TsaB
MKDIFILNIETATKACSVSLSKNGELLCIEEELSEKYIHSERLTTFIDKILTYSKITFKDLNAIAVSKGPGSFTGLRIGVSTAKGLCYGLDIPLIAINTLDSLCANFLHNNQLLENEVLVPMIDARRREVYTLIKDKYSNIIDTSAIEITSEFFYKLDNYNKIHLLGDGCNKFKKEFSSEKIEYHIHISCSAASMVESSYIKFKNKTFEDLACFEPYYLKDFKAF